MLNSDDKVLIVGYTGKLGHCIYAYLIHYYPNQIFGINSSQCLTNTLLTLKPSLIIDVTSASCIDDHILIYHQFKIKTLIGTSGISKNTMQKIILQKYPIMIFINFAYALTQLITEAKTQSIDHIYETHCITKKDQPAATAVYLKQYLAPNAQISSVRVAKKIAQHTLIAKNMNISCKIDRYSMYLPGLLYAIKSIFYKDSPSLFIAPEVELVLRNFC
ncbi:hypothetical protein OAT84_02660 [Gammaproteobacteria bacterium]|nr:hypothetical protein [Gammaproteobacteria bacterium]